MAIAAAQKSIDQNNALAERMAKGGNLDKLLGVKNGLQENIKKDKQKEIDDYNEKIKEAEIEIGRLQQTLADQKRAVDREKYWVDRNMKLYPK